MRSFSSLRFKAVLLFIFILFLSLQLSPQSRMIDSLQKALSRETSLLHQFAITSDLTTAYIRTGNMDKVPDLLKRLFEIAEDFHNDSLLMLSYLSIAQYLDYQTDTKPELEYIIKAQKIAEKKYPAQLPVVYYSIANVYEDLGKFEEALKYLRKTQSLLSKGFTLPESRESYYYFHFANVFIALNQPDSALHYIQLANVVSLKNKDGMINTQISAHLGLINEMLGNTKLASNYYVNSIDIADSLHTSFAFGSVANQYSRFLLKQNEFNKAKYFAEKALSAAKNAGTKSLILSIAKTLRNIHEVMGNTDSAYYYSKVELAYRDSLFNQQKVNEIHDLTFNEELRQIQETAKQKEASEIRRRNIQYSAIAIGIISLLILFLLLSRSIIVNAKIIEIVGVIGLLLVLEFIYLLLHPFLEKSTNHSPVVMLLALVCIASLIVPMHHKFEKWMIHQLVEKNKKIRLAAAKKTISELDEKNSVKDQRSEK